MIAATAPYWVLLVIIMSLSSLVLIMLSVIHTYVIMRDFHSRNIRISTNDDQYTKLKLVSISTVTSIYCFTAVLVGNAILPWSFVMYYCWFLTSTISAIYGLAKVMMYLVFLLKLDIIYASTAYSYNRKKLSIIAASIVALYVLVMPFHYLTWRIDPFEYDHIHMGSIRAIKCNSQYSIFSASMLTLMDIGCSIGFLVAFVRPIRKITANVKMCSPKHENSNELLDMATKVMLLTGSACISSLLLLLSLMVYPAVGVLLMGVDAIINVSALMLMTSLYPERYFKCLCCCCIRVCCTSLTHVIYLNMDDASHGNVKKESSDQKKYTSDDQETTQNANDGPAGNGNTAADINIEMECTSGRSTASNDSTVS